MRWETVIGLEIHTRLKTDSKLFSGASAHYDAPPNSQACGIDIALPGVLPVLNDKAVRMAIAFGLAIGAEITAAPVFARKNYFYPDLPKGYQISQYEKPIVGRGKLEIICDDGSTKTIGITRAHLEEDAGKSVHEGYGDMSGIDLNRAGTALIEIVSEPDIRSTKEASIYMKKIHSIVRYLGICDGNMQEGSLRCDANVSVRPFGDEELGTRTEIKNLNSFRFVEQAIAFEIERQIGVLEGGGVIVQETRLFDVAANQTRVMRTKGDAHDYRYFPDPDLLPLEISAALIDEVRRELPEAPEVKQKRFVNEYGLDQAEVIRLTEDYEAAVYFEACVTATKADAKTVMNWMNGTLAAALNKANMSIGQARVSAKALAELLDCLVANKISTSIARKVFDQMWQGQGSVAEIIQQGEFHQITDSAELESVVEQVIAESPKQLQQYREGKEKVFAYFVGQVMKITKGKADPQQVNHILKQKLMV